MNLKRALLAGGVSALLCMAGSTVMAQANGGGGGGGGFGGRRGGGNFDPAQFQQRMMDNIRERMDVKSDDEWKVIETRVQKVMDARRELGPAGGMGRMFRGGRRGGNNDGGPGGGQGGGRRGGMFGQQMPELTALENAIENNAPTEQIKAALEKYRAARKVKEAALEQAQAELQKVLTVKQEAVAVTLGLLN